MFTHCSLRSFNPLMGFALSLLIAGNSSSLASDYQPDSVHELDPLVVAQFRQVAYHLAQLDNLAKQKSSLTLLAQIVLLQRQLEKARKEYSYTSPAMILLGPIGTASIVLKEQKIEQLLKKIAFDVHLYAAQLLSTRTHLDAFDRCSLSDCIEANERLLSSMYKVS